MTLIKFFFADDYYLGWVVAPLFFTVVLPFFFLFMFYVNIVIILIYTLHWGQVKAAYGISLKNGALHLMAASWDVHSRIWHGRLWAYGLKFSFNEKKKHEPEPLHSGIFQRPIQLLLFQMNFLINAGSP